MNNLTSMHGQYNYFMYLFNDILSVTLINEYKNINYYIHLLTILKFDICIYNWSEI